MPEKSLNKFEISAPGKVILNGEHSVVYGKHAIAGPIGLRTHFKYERRTNNYVTFEYRKLGAVCKLSLEDVNLFLKEHDFFTNLTPTDAATMFKTNDSPLFKYVTFNRGLKVDEKIGYCLTSTMYLLNHIFRAVGVKEVEHAFHVTIDSDMSIGAGMGSSASFGVCLAAGLYVVAEIEEGRFDVQKAKEFTFKDNLQVLEKVSGWAFNSEVIMHEKPSGIDNTICTHGNLIIFKKGETPVNLKFDDELQILIVDSNVSRSTSKLVARVSEKNLLFPKVFGAIFDAIEELVFEVQAVSFVLHLFIFTLIVLCFQILGTGTKDNTDNFKKFEVCAEV
jgi:mevalonate kinase